MDSIALWVIGIGVVALWAWAKFRRMERDDMTYGELWRLSRSNERLTNKIIGLWEAFGIEQHHKEKEKIISTVVDNFSVQFDRFRGNLEQKIDFLLAENIRLNRALRVHEEYRMVDRWKLLSALRGDGSDENDLKALYEAGIITVKSKKEAMEALVKLDFQNVKSGVIEDILVRLEGIENRLKDVGK